MDARDSKHALVWAGSFASAGGVVALFPSQAGAVALLVAAVVLALIAFDGRRQRPLVAACLLLLVLGAGRASRAIARHEAQRSAVIEEGGWPARCAIKGTVASSPMQQGEALRIVIEATELACPNREPRSVKERMTVHVPIELTIPARGDEVTVIASVAPPYRFWNDGTGDPRPSAARRQSVLSGGAEDVVITRPSHGIPAFIDHLRAHARARIVATFPRDAVPMARALILGEDDLAPEDQVAFRSSGLSHLLAVSGMHLVLVVMTIVRLIQAVLVRTPLAAGVISVDRIASAIGLPLAWLYADFAGGSGSAIRAAWMCTAVLGARALGRRTSAWRALGLSLLAMALIDPLVVFDVSFLLSALATTGLLVFSAPIETRILTWFRLHSSIVRSFVVKPFAATLAATIACAPALAMMAPELALGGLIANVVAIPLGELAALPLCLLHGVLVIWPDAEAGAAGTAWGALVLVRKIAHAFTWGTVPIPAPTAAQIGAVVLLAACRALTGLRVVAIGPLALLALELVARLDGAPKGVLRVTFLDVGQGDSALIDFPDGSAMVIDGGGLVGSPIDVGARVVAPVLAARRRSAIDTVVVSHPHPDHFLGLASGLDRIRVRDVWDTGQGERENLSYAAFLQSLRARHVEVMPASKLCGSREQGGVQIDVLAPCPLAPDRGPNDNSFVIRLRYKNRSFLFVGDSEHEAESDLLRGDVRADVLKVGHHGSRTSSTPAFLAAVHPSIAVVSTGVRNRFGHPHPTTMASLATTRARIYRTDRDGSVIVTTDGNSLLTRTIAAR